MVIERLSELESEGDGAAAKELARGVLQADTIEHIEICEADDCVVVTTTHFEGVHDIDLANGVWRTTGTYRVRDDSVDVEIETSMFADSVVYFGLGGGELQVGYPVRTGEWPTVRAAGFDAFRDRVAAVDPRLGPAVDAHLDGFRDTRLLDVAPGVADAWTRDGLVLLGDAAHTASPIGAQGNPLAVEDAVVVHDLLVGALADEEGILSGGTLRNFETRRRPTVEDVISLQRRAADGLAFWLDYGRYVPAWLVRGSAAALGRSVPRSRRVRGSVESFALGDRSVSVARSYFAD